jgi:hypothetical protein
MGYDGMAGLWVKHEDTRLSTHGSEQEIRKFY